MPDSASMTDARDKALAALLADTGFAAAKRTPLAGDASTRAYEFGRPK